MFKPLKWTVAGTVAERRELKTKENKVFGHSLKLATVGATFDIRIPEHVYAQIGEGEALEVRGGVSMYNNNIQLAATHVYQIPLDTDGNAAGEPKLIEERKGR